MNILLKDRQAVKSISSFRIPGYDIDQEILAIDHDIATKKAEVNQDYVKWEVREKKSGNVSDTVKVIDFIVPDPPKNPLPDPKDTHLPPYNEDSIFWREYLIRQRNFFSKNKYVHLKGEHVRNVLIHCFDARAEDVEELKDSHDNLNHDPNMDVLKIAAYRLGFVIYLPNFYIYKISFGSNYAVTIF